MRVSCVTEAHVSSNGPVLIDVLLDHAGVPDGVDLAWRTKHFLGASVPGANFPMLNLTQVVMAVEFTVAEIAETASGTEAASTQSVPAGLPAVDADALEVPIPVAAPSL